MKKVYLLLLCAALSACGTTQSIVKSIFPYTTNVVIPLTAETDKEYDATGQAKSFDQVFSSDGNNAYKVNGVRITSAKVQATIPSDYNIGNIASIKLFMGKPDGKDEVLVAQRTDIGPNQSKTLVLDIDNSRQLDQLVRQPNVRVRMVYKLRKKATMDVTLHVTLGITANPAD